MADTFFDPADPGFRAITDLFVAELPEKIQSLETALASNSWGSLRRVGHQLKGAAACYGFDELTHPAFNLQRVCDQQLTDEAITDAANRLIEACQAAIERYEAAAPA